ncbi:hypothetical protein LARV_00221 [Longilinea arvoryzae]|uniref:Uncharacterized protein n=1 Tax=Longilinea arvoryzae TaxID=360412 RepID=A0A0S7BDP8_9CHLR|nr:hypothetical protein LARV_00221 [Longilinea arvoryzae]
MTSLTYSWSGLLLLGDEVERCPQIQTGMFLFRTNYLVFTCQFHWTFSLYRFLRAENIQTPFNQLSSSLRKARPDQPSQRMMLKPSGERSTERMRLAIFRSLRK